VHFERRGCKFSACQWRSALRSDAGTVDWLEKPYPISGRDVNGAVALLRVSGIRSRGDLEEPEELRPKTG
jgi:hypothetical protein